MTYIYIVSFTARISCTQLSDYAPGANSLKTYNGSLVFFTENKLTEMTEEDRLKTFEKWEEEMEEKAFKDATVEYAEEYVAITSKNDTYYKPFFEDISSGNYTYVIDSSITSIVRLKD